MADIVFKDVFTPEEKVQILKDLVAIKSVNNDEIEVAKYLHDFLSQYGIDSQILPFNERRANLVAEIGSGHPILGVSGHMDVVEPGDISAWTSDPFTLTERDGKLYGRGASDMKPGLADLVITMVNIKENNLLKHGTIRLMATFGEEIGEEGSAKFKDDGYTKDIDALLIAEPTVFQVGIGHKGSMDIRLLSHGKEAHSSMPDRGYNTIDPLMDLLVKANQQFRHSDRHNDLLGDLTFNTTIFHGGNQVNSIPGEATAEMNARTIPEYDNQAVADDLQELIDAENKNGANIEKDVYMSQPSIETDGKSRLVKLAEQLSKKYSPYPVNVISMGGVTDASNLIVDKPHDFPFVVLGPGNPTAHQVNEYIEKQVYLDFTDLYIQLFTEYLNN